MPMGFAKDLELVVECAFMGLYHRLDQGENDPDLKKFSTLIAKACSLSSFLNFSYGLEFNHKRLLPETEWEMLNMLEFPLNDIIDKLPEPLKQEVYNETHLIRLDALFEIVNKDGTTIDITDDGYELLGYAHIAAALNSTNPISESLSHKIFHALLESGNYEKCRFFLEDRANAYIKDNRIDMEPEQMEFIDAFPKLFSLCYQKSLRSNIYRCNNCGSILRERQPDVFSCVSKKCKNDPDKKILVETNFSGWILNDVATRYIYIPGQLEMAINDILKQGETNGRILSFVLWPGKTGSCSDTWDFKVNFSNGDLWVIDAKDIENPRWLIEDEREYPQKPGKFVYIVPNDRSKSYLETVNQNSAGKYRCLKLNQLRDIVLGEK